MLLPTLATFGTDRVLFDSDCQYAYNGHIDAVHGSCTTGPYALESDCLSPAYCPSEELLPVRLN